MRQSQTVLLAALAVCALCVVLAAGVARVALSELANDSGGPRSAAPGPPTTRTLALTGFREVDVNGTWAVTVTRGGTWNVEISFPENLENDLRVRVDGDRLVLAHDWNGNWNRNSGGSLFTARVSMPELAAADVSGAGRLDFSGFSGERLVLDVSGVGAIEGEAGRYDFVVLDASSSARVDLRGVPVVDANVDLSGAARVVLEMNGGVLSGDLSGAGQVEYYGTIREQRVDVSGAGSIVSGN
jgi:hypothetical protein